MPPPLHNILVICSKYLTQVVLATPVLRALRQKYPDSQIFFLTRESYASLLEENPWSVQPVGLTRNAKPRNLLKLVRSLHPDLMIDLSQTWRTRMLSFASGAHKRLRSAGGKRSRFVNALDANLTALGSLKIASENKQPEINLTAAELEWAEYYLMSGAVVSEKPVITIYPGARWENKIWPFERFVSLIKKMHESDWQVVLLRADYDEGPMLQRLMDRVPNEVICASDLPLRRMAAILQMSDVFVGNYSGLLHLAIAVGTSAVGLFGPDDPAVWFPYSAEQGYQALSEPVSCRPCYKNVCPLGTLECLKLLEVETVFAAVKRSLALVR